MLTSIADRLTPTTPIEITFGEQPVSTGRKWTTLFAHKAQSGGTSPDYSVHTVLNAGDPLAAKKEIDVLAGTDGEASKMAQAFVSANSSVPGRSNFPSFRICFLPFGEAGFGGHDEAITAVKTLRSDMFVSPYPASNENARTRLLDLATLISGVDRDLVGQFGSFVTFGEVSAFETALALNLDHQAAIIAYMQDLAGPSQTPAILAAKHAAVMMGQAFPYAPLNSAIVGGALPPMDLNDRIDLSPNGMSELALASGLSPLYVDASGNVRIVRSRTTKVTLDGSTPASAYFDWQDLAVLYDFRESVYLRLQASDMKAKKASFNQAKLIKDEILRIAYRFEEEGAFQAVKQLAPSFVVEPSSSSRGRFDFKIPVNVVPGLFVVAGNIQATTLFDQFTL